jgi:hypothetical protein
MEFIRPRDRLELALPKGQPRAAIVVPEEALIERGHRQATICCVALRTSLAQLS